MHRLRQEQRRKRHEKINDKAEKKNRFQVNERNEIWNEEKNSLYIN